MNIFDIYLDKIKKLVIKLNKKSLIEIPESLNGIKVDVPPDKFDCDISTNVAMILSKSNKKSPLDLANQLSEFIKKDDKNINLINVVNPGFINIKFEESSWNNFLKEIISNHKTFFSINPDHSQIWMQSGEWVVCNFRFCCRNRTNKG